MLGLLVIADRLERELAGVDRDRAVADQRVLDSIGGVVNRQRLVGQLEDELGRADAHGVPLSSIASSIRWPLTNVPLRLVGVVDVPAAVVAANDRVHARAKRVVERHRALDAAADSILGLRVEKKPRAGLSAERYGEVGVFAPWRRGFLTAVSEWDAIDCRRLFLRL